MTTTVYILYSEKLDRFYTGITTIGIQERLENHLQKKYGKNNFTQKADDWKIYWFLECVNYSQARKIEIHIKKMKSKEYIRNLGAYSGLKKKLLSKFPSEN